MSSKNPIRRSAVPKRNRQLGFTLVELMVVIAIVAVLALIVFGLSSKMIQKAKKVASVNGMRQVAVGTLSYATENNGSLSRVIFSGENTILFEPIPGQGDRWVSNTFWGRLHPYLFSDISPVNQSELAAKIKERLAGMLSTKKLNIMQGTPFQDSRIYSDSSGISLPFAFNSSVSQWNKLTKSQSFDDAARIVYFSYGFSTFNESDAQVAVPPPIKNPSAESNIFWYPDKTAAFTFIDGHVEVLSPPLASERFK
jgi:prepilin-type N-terminal cleavage/methylation domain-containing protein